MEEVVTREYQWGLPLTELTKLDYTSCRGDILVHCAPVTREHRIALQVTFKLIIRFYSFLANYPQIDDISNPQQFRERLGGFIYTKGQVNFYALSKAITTTLVGVRACALVKRLA